MRRRVLVVFGGKFRATVYNGKGTCSIQVKIGHILASALLYFLIYCVYLKRIKLSERNATMLISLLAKHFVP